jgi:hypothetical protein
MDCATHNLVFIPSKLVNHAPSFEKVRQYLAEEAPDIATYMWNDDPHKYRRWIAALRPTMIFSPVPVNKFRAVRGRLFCGHDFPKSEEYAALDKAGITVPRYRMLTKDQPRCDVTDFGKYVVVKPDKGARGANVRIMRATRARWEAGKNSQGKDNDPLIAQEFIYTGQWPVCHRVTTLFGKVLWAVTWEANNARDPLESGDAFDKTRGVNIVASSKGCTGRLLFDEEIIRFGEAAHAAFPNIPLCGWDIVRRHEDGKLFVVEANASGFVWHFSSPMGTKFQTEFGFNLESQFDGLRKAARVLAEVTRQRAA